MKVEEVKKLTPRERLLYWIRERESIRLKKEAGELKPWTDDGVLQSYRFCNVRRMDDKVSRWLLDNWYKPHFGHRNMLVACALARFINLPESLASVGFPKKWRPCFIKETLHLRMTRGLLVYNSAYVIPALGKGSKVDIIIDRVIQPLYDDSPNVDGISMESCWVVLRKYLGFGSFLAGQVVADLRWAMPGEWKDRYTWAPMGPGSLRGLNRLAGRPLQASISQRQFVDELRELIKWATPKLPSIITSRMEAHDWQNSLCESDKVARVLDGEGKPKQRYAGV